MSDTKKKFEQAIREASELPTPPERPASDHIQAAPRISVQAFCELEATATAMKSAGDDRRLAKAHLTVKMGGMAAAVEAYHNAPTPNVIVLESSGKGELLPMLDDLPHACD